MGIIEQPNAGSVPRCSKCRFVLPNHSGVCEKAFPKASEANVKTVESQDVHKETGFKALYK